MISLVILARVRFYRDGLADLFEALDGFRVAAVTGAHADAVAQLRSLAPSILLVAAEGERADEVRELAAASPATRIIALGIEDEGVDVLPLVEAGVVGYVTVDASAEELVRVVESVARGEMPCSPRIAAELMQRLASLSRERTPRDDLDALTVRERQIVELLDGGLSNKEIAHRLSIEPATVKNHVHNILEKLNVARRADAAALLRRT